MLGRGIDQILPHPVDPRLQERFVSSASTYVRLAQEAHGPIPRSADPAYVWGDALPFLEERAAAALIVNLETSITTSDAFWPKGVNYRMAPRNVSALTAAPVACCVLANNHVMDFGREGLIETLGTLEAAGVPFAGAGRNGDAAAAPAVLPAGGNRRILVFALGATSSGIPPEWAANEDVAGVALLPDLSDATLARLADRAEAARRRGDILVASIHWGGNWGHEVPADQVRFAHAMVEAGFHVVHGHSSHHAKAVEIHRGRPILYGAGDFITDYEGISGHEVYRGDLSLAWVLRVSDDGALAGLSVVPFRMRRFRLERAPAEDVAWLRKVLDRQSRSFGTRITEGPDGTLTAVPS